MNSTTHTSCDLFTSPLLSTSVTHGYYHYLRPTTSIDADDAPIEFFIPPTSEYLDLSLTRLKLKCKITLEDGNPIPIDSKVSVVNNFSHSLFSSIHIELSNVPINQSSGSYAYRSVIERLLNYGFDATNTQLRNSLFILDTPGFMNADEKNIGYVRRREATRDVFETESSINSDIFNIQKFMISHVPILIRFYRSKADFVLLTDASDLNKYKIQILEVTLIVRRVKVANSIALAHNLTLNSGPAIYPINRTETRSFVISKDLIVKSLDNIFIGQLPFRVSVALVEQEAYSGNITLNPFDFKHFNYAQLKLKTDSNIDIPEIKVDFDKKMYIDAFNSMVYNSGIRYLDAGNSLTYENFAKGYHIAVFDLTQDLSSSSSHWCMQNSGVFGIDIKFSKALKSPIILILLAEFRSIIEIDKNRNVLIDYRR